MKRLVALRYIVEVELYPVAMAMLDGSYYQEPLEQSAAQLANHHDPAFWE